MVYDLSEAFYDGKSELHQVGEINVVGTLK